MSKKEDPELGSLTVCYWRPPDRKYPWWPGGWYPIPPDRREEFRVVRAPKRKKKGVA